jgi:WD40 repeat protein
MRARFPLLAWLLAPLLALILALLGLTAGCSGGPPAGGGAPAGQKAAQAGTCPAAPPGPHTAPGTFVVQDGHTNDVQAIALNASGSMLASAGADAAVRVWDASAGLMLRRIPTAGVWVGIALGVSLSASGDIAAFKAHDGTGVTISLVDLARGGAPRTVSPDGWFQLSPDGRTLAVGLNGLRRIDTRTGETTGEIDVRPVRAVAFDRDGRRLAAAFDGEIALVDTASWTITRRWPHPDHVRMTDNATWLGFAGDDLLLRTVVGAVYVMGLRDDRPARRIPGAFADVAIAGERLFAIDQQTRKLCTIERASGAVATIENDSAPRLRFLTASADGSTLALVSLDVEAGYPIHVWDARTLRPLRTVRGFHAGVSRITIRPDGEQLTTGAVQGDLARWSLTSGELLGLTAAEERSKIVGLSYGGADASVVATSAGTYWVRVRDAARFKILRQWDAHGQQPLSHAGFLPGSFDLITTARDGSVKRWDLAPAPSPARKRPFFRFDEVGKPAGRDLAKVSFPIEQAALSPDATALVIAGDKGQLAVLGTQDGSVRWEIAAPTVVPRRWVAFSPDAGSVLDATFENLPNAEGQLRATPVLRVFDARAGALQRTLRLGTAGPIATRGSTVAIGGRRPQLLVWPEARSFASVDADQEITAVAAHPTRDLFLMGGEGGVTRVVAASTGRVLVLLQSTAEGEFVSATPEGAYLASLDGARSIAWTFAAPFEAFSFEQFAARFNRPEIVASRLAGEAAAAPVPVRRPPRVTLDASIPAETDAPRILVKARVESPHRVDRVRVFVNGRAATERMVCAATADVAIDVPLRSGRNRITVIAYDAEGFASNPAARDVTVKAPAGQPALWAVSLGISRYPNMAKDDQLDFADDDARAIAASLAGQAGPGRAFATLHATTLTDSLVTVESVEKAIAGLAEMAPDDLAVLFFAGHGARLPDGQMVFLTSKGALTGEGARRHGVGWSRIQASLARARGRVMLLLDACHSGHITTELVAPNEALAAELAAENRTGVLVLAASRGSQLSYEVEAQGYAGGVRGQALAWDGQPARVPPLAGGHGLFTSAVLEAFGGGAPDRDRSGAIELGEFIGYVTERVRAASNGQQTPWVARREMFGDFTVAPAKP